MGKLLLAARQQQLGWTALDRVRTPNDLWLLGPMPMADLRRFPRAGLRSTGSSRSVAAFRRWRDGGNKRRALRTAYREDEFQAAFVTPFLRVAEATGFPRGEPWLWVGPSGPHIIGKVVRELARQTGSMDPFSVDFDPRWAKRLADGSTGRQRYPRSRYDPGAGRDAPRGHRRPLSSHPRPWPPWPRASATISTEAIRGIHYGGMSLTPEVVNDFRAAFPRAVHLAGYGNTLFGVVMEDRRRSSMALDYFPLGDRVQFHVVDWPDDGEVQGTWPPSIRERRTNRPGGLSSP